MVTPHPHRLGLPGGWVWRLALAGLLAVTVAGSLGRTPAAPTAQAQVVNPVVAPAPAALGDDTHLLYLPFIRRNASTPVNLVNGGFENHNWYTDYTHAGNQWPYGWTFYSTENGHVMPFPTKGQQGSVVPAIAGGWGEYVHKLQRQLPEPEYVYAPRGLIIDGYTTYKAFSAAIPHALRLSQTLTGTPGAVMQVTGYILGETYDTPWWPNTKLEDDHWVASVQLGSAADTRPYATMVQRHDVPGNVRNWNRFTVSAVIPPNGQLLLKVIVQQNWAGRTDFFIDAFSAVQLQ